MIRFFLIPELQKTAAEISLNEKNSMSHRAKALDLLLKRLAEFYK